MARKPDPARIYQARRDAIGSRLTGSGMPQDDAERWLAAWEARAVLGGLDVYDRDFWQAGADWIEAELAAPCLSTVHARARAGD
jgi:hypothetical protein